MMVQAEEVFDSGLNMNSTWLGQYGLRIASNIPWKTTSRKAYSLNHCNGAYPAPFSYPR